MSAALRTLGRLRADKPRRELGFRRLALEAPWQWRAATVRRNPAALSPPRPRMRGRGEPSDAHDFLYKAADEHNTPPTRVPFARGGWGGVHARLLLSLHPAFSQTTGRAQRPEVLGRSRKL